MDKKYKAILSKLDPDAKASLCSGLDGWRTKPLPESGIGSIFMADGPNGLRKEIKKEDGKTAIERATCFPSACLMASSFDINLLREMGTALAPEARSKGVNLLLGPGINIKRSPLCGRNFEYYSEDPHLTGELAAAFVDGLQQAGVGATLKHFAMNNQEKARLSSSSVADERARREIYLAAFETVIKKANPWAVMSSYNKVDGVYTSENSWLLRDLLRGEWGYQGVTMSDWGAVNDRVLGLQAGLDLEMPGNDGIHDRMIVQAVRSGSLDPACVDESVGHILALVEKAGQTAPRPSVDPSLQHDLARWFAAESMVLLKNEAGLLPLLSTQSLGVIGEFARKPRYQGGGSANVHPTRLLSFLDELPSFTGQFEFEPGYIPENDSPDEGLIQAAVEMAKKKDVVLIFAGLPNSYESEGYDRPHMGLPEAQNELICRVAQANPKVAVILFAGGPVEMPWIEQVRAILMCYLPGQAGAGAAADILFGKVSPSGRLPESFPLKWEDSPCYNYFGQENIVEYRESIFVGYRYFGKARPVLFPFGHGLSYSQFTYSDLRLKVLENGEVSVHVTVKNTGTVKAAEVIQVYVEPPPSTVARPEQELRAFGKVLLQPGESVVQEFRLPFRAFAFYNTLISDWHVLAGSYRIRVGASSRDIRLEGELTLPDNHPGSPIPDLRQVAPEYYDLDELPHIQDSSFSALLGRPLPIYSARPFTRNSTLKEISECALGRQINKLVRKFTLGGDNAAPQEGQDLRVMLERQADYLPLFSIVSGTRGAISDDMLDGLILYMNRKRLQGVLRFFKAWRASRKASAK